MKQLHGLILRRLPGPFLAAFGSLMFLLLMQFLMRHLKDLVGKGLSGLVIAEIIVYNLSYMVVLAVPMAVLVATLAVFGRISELGYYRVIKSSGISLTQLAWPVWLASLILVGGMMYFNNEILPESNYRAKALWYDIRQAKPGFALEPGVFYDGVDGYSIRVAAVDQESSRLEGITVFDYTDEAAGRITLAASRGRLEAKNRGLKIDLILEDGEMHRLAPGSEEQYERMSFGRYLVPLDLSDTAFGRSDLTSTSRSDRTTRTSVMLVLVDSLFATAARQANDLKIDLADIDAAPFDSVRSRQIVQDSVNRASELEVVESAVSVLRKHRNRAQDLASARRYTLRRANRFLVEIHKKFSIAVACFIFVLIGVPLGLRVRRGGLGVVSAMSIGIFLIYWISLVQGEKLADRGFLEPWVGMWAANILVGGAAIGLVAVVSMDLRNRRWRWKNR
jgi:lipopolysaccharide export system permease protein